MAHRLACRLADGWYWPGSVWRDDAVSAAMEELWRCAQTYDEGRGFTFLTWWYRQMKRAMIDELRRINRGSRSRGEKDEPGRVEVYWDGRAKFSLAADPDPDPSEVAVANVELERWERAIAQLPEGHEELARHLAGGGSMQSMATRDDVTISAVWQRKSRLRRRLGHLLDEGRG